MPAHFTITNMRIISYSKTLSFRYCEDTSSSHLNPESGPVIEGTGGIRKVRFPLENRGKSGSVRICYTDFAEYEVTYLITAFTKKDQENLTDEEKRVLRKLVKSLRDAERDRRKSL